MSDGKRGIIFGDVHQIAGRAYHPSYLMLKRFADHYRPEFVVNLGDFFDFPYLARFNQDNLKELTDASFADDYSMANQDLDDWQEAAEEYILLEGNHEERIARLLEAQPRFEGLVEIKKNLKLSEREIPFIRQVDQPLKFESLHVLHGFYANEYHAAKHLRIYMTDVMYGHTHSFQNHAIRRPLDNKTVEAHGVGCLCDLQPGWRRGQPTKWTHGFAIVEFRGKGHSIYPIKIQNGMFSYGGETWSLTEFEKKLARERPVT